MVADGDQSALTRCNSVWIHGAGLAGDTWDAMTVDLPLAQKPDLPGHGDAPLVDQRRVETYAKVLADQIQANTVVIGHSLGGMVALELAMRAKDRVAALILVEAVPTVRDRLSGRLSATISAALFKAIPLSWFTWLSGVGQTEATRTELCRQMARMDPPRIIAALDAAASYDGRPHLPLVAVPTVIIVGRKNKATHRGSKLMADSIPGAQMVTMGGGHMLHNDNPEGLRQAIADFVGSVWAGRGEPGQQ